LNPHNPDRDSAAARCSEADLQSRKPEWADEEVAGFIVSSTMLVALGHPRLHPEAPETDLFLDVEEDQDAVEYLWRISISEEEAGFGPSEYGAGNSADLEEAKHDAWLAAIEFLRGEGYGLDEIAQSA
jgi:hypothetical protein